MIDPFAGWDAHPYCYLTTTGRVTGRPHRIEIWFVVWDGAAWLLTSGATDWVRNLRADPAATLEIGDVRTAVRGTVAEGTAAGHPVRALLAARYAHAEEGLEAWAATATAVRLDPAGL